MRLDTAVLEPQIADSVEHAPLPLTEVEIVDALTLNLHCLGTVTAWAAEVRSHGRARADLCAVLDGRLVAFEAKRDNWQRALAQAVLNKFCVDESYMALWGGRIPLSALAAAADHGIGVVAVSATRLDILVTARRWTPDEGVRQRMFAVVTRQEAGL